MQSSAEIASKPVFVFTGMGPLWWAMGHELLENEPVFRDSAEKCDAAFQRLAGWSILAEMSADEDQSQIAWAHVAPAANFVLQAGLTALWRDWGVEPAATVGHSLGEVAAAHAAGALDLKDAVELSYHLGRLLKRRAGTGAMLAVGLSKEQLQGVLGDQLDGVCIAAVNSPLALTLAGEQAALERIASTLDRYAFFNRFLQVDVAYHSHHIEPVRAHLREALSGLRVRAPTIPLYSTLTGRRAGAELLEPEYWCDNLREPVLFESAIGSLIQAGHRVFLQIGPHPVLSKSTEECLLEQGVPGTVLGSLRRGQPERQSLHYARECLHRSRHAADRKGLGPSTDAWKLLSELTTGFRTPMSGPI